MLQNGLAKAAAAGLATFGIVLAFAMIFGRTEVPAEAAATLRLLYLLLAASIGLVTTATLYAAER